MGEAEENWAGEGMWEDSGTRCEFWSIHVALSGAGFCWRVEDRGSGIEWLGGKHLAPEPGQDVTLVLRSIAHTS